MSKETTEDKVAAPGDLGRAYTEEKLRMRSAKAVMSKNIMKLEQKGLNLPNGSLLKVATEIEQNVEAVKDSYSKMEELNESLLQKLILVDRANKINDVEKAVDELTAPYFEKCVTS